MQVNQYNTTSATSGVTSYNPDVVHGFGNQYKDYNLEQLPDWETAQRKMVKLTDEFSINEEMFFAGMFSENPIVIDDTRNEHIWDAVFDYKYLQLNPTTREGEWGNTAWLSKSSISAYVHEYRMYHIFSKNSVTYGKYGKAMQNIYVEELLKNFTRIKARLINNTFILGSTKIYAKGKQTFAALTETDNFEIDEVYAIVNNLIKHRILLSSSQALILIPSGTMEEVYASVGVKGAMDNRFTPITDQVYSGANVFNYKGMQIIENAMVYSQANGEVNPLLSTDNVNGNADTFYTYIYAKAGPDLLPGITITTRENQQEVVVKDYGNLFGGDMHNEFASVSISLKYGVNLTDTTKVISYISAKRTSTISGAVFDAWEGDIMKNDVQIPDSMQLLSNATATLTDPVVSGNQIDTQATITLNNGGKYDWTNGDENSSLRANLVGTDYKATVVVNKSGAISFSNVPVGTYTIDLELAVTELVAADDPSGRFNAKVTQLTTISLLDAPVPVEVAFTAPVRTELPQSSGTTVLSIKTDEPLIKQVIPSINSVELVHNDNIETNKTILYPVQAKVVEKYTNLELGENKIFANDNELKRYVTISDLSPMETYLLEFIDNNQEIIENYEFTTK